MLLIQEAVSVNSTAEIIQESVSPEGLPRIKFFARLQDTLPNQNGRVYTIEALRAISKGLSQKSQNYGLLGELGHPVLKIPIKTTNRKWTDQELTDIAFANKKNALIDYENSCIRLNNVRTEGNENVAEGMTTLHGKGREAYLIMKDDLPNAGFSVRISGKPDKTGKVIPSSITPYTYDFVYLPSHKNATVVEILSESSAPYMEMLREIDGTLAMLENKLNVIGDNNQIILESQNGSLETCPEGVCVINSISNVKAIREFLIQETFSAYKNRNKSIILRLNEL